MSPILQASNPIYDSNPLFVLGLTISWLNIARFTYLLNKAHVAHSSTPSYETPFHILSACTIYFFLLPWNIILDSWVNFPDQAWSVNVMLILWNIVMLCVEGAFLLALCAPYWIWYRRAEEQFWARKMDPRANLPMKLMRRVAEMMAEDNGEDLTVLQKVKGVDDVMVLEMRKD
jgi:hypothetical protein